MKRKQQQMGIRQRPHGTMSIRTVKHHIQGIVPFLHLQLCHIAPANRLQLSVRHHHFSHRTTNRQQAVQITA